MPSLDDLVANWRGRPTAAATIELCEVLGGAGTEALAGEVGEGAQTERAADVGVMLAVGRMYSRLGWLAEAQTALALAAKADARDPRPFAELGHVLLLRGDAPRAQLALQRALGLGAVNPAVSEWLDAATETLASHAHGGTSAVQEALEALQLEWEDPTVVRAAPFDAPPSPFASPEDELPLAEPPSPFAPPEDAAPFPPLAAVSDTDAPTLEATLDRLAACGLGGSGSDEWEPAGGGTAAGVRVLVVAAAAAALVLFSGHLLAARVRAERVERARTDVEAFRRELASVRVEGADARTTALARLFALDAQSTDVAAAFLAERTLGAIWQPEAPPGLAEAVLRAEAAGVAPARIEAGRAASRLAADDVEGALAIVRGQELEAAEDPLFVLVTGAVLERAGDAEALERYQRAAELAPNSVPARVQFARLSLLEDGAAASRRVVARLAAELGDDPIARTLSRLAWAVDVGRTGPPASVRLTDEECNRLPRPLRFVRSFVDAVLAVDRGERASASEQVAIGLGATAAPAEVTALGMVAARAGDEVLARRSVDRVRASAPEYAGLPALAARVALLRGRFAEAIRAASLGATRRELALVFCIDAYERLDGAGIRAGLAALPGDVTRDAEAAALALAPAALEGARLPELETLHDLGALRVVWGELVSVDFALDAGRVDVARTLVRGWAPRAERYAPYAVRLARLARIAGKPDVAVRFATFALGDGDATPRAVIELVRASIEAGDGSAARAQLALHADALDAPTSTWLEVMATAVERGPREATVLASRQALPPPDAPVALAALAARALAEVGDLRARQVVQRLAARASAHPDLVAALRGHEAERPR